VTAWSSGSGWFTPKSFITISVAQVRCTLRVTTSFTVSPTLALTSAGVKPSDVTVTGIVRTPFLTVPAAAVAAAGTALAPCSACALWAGQFSQPPSPAEASAGAVTASRAAGASFHRFMRVS
jgi:hypothetical protein